MLIKENDKDMESPAVSQLLSKEDSPLRGYVVLVDILCTSLQVGYAMLKKHLDLLSCLIFQV